MSVAWVGAGIAAAGVLSNAYSSNQAQNAQEDAANQANATARSVSDQQTALQKDQFDKNYALQKPIYDDGSTARNRLMQLLGLTAGGDGNGSATKNFGMSDFQQDPGYQFRMDQGQKALERSAAARGGLLSGSAAKDTMRFAQGLGSQEYQSAFDRFQVNRSNQLNPLLSLSGNGQVAAGALGSAGQNYANSAGSALGQYGQTVGNNQTGMGNVRASGYLANGNSLTNMLNQGYSAYKNSRSPSSNYDSSSAFGGGQSGWSNIDEYM